jgi:hypothetical protein
VEEDDREEGGRKLLKGGRNGGLDATTIYLLIVFTQLEALGLVCAES